MKERTVFFIIINFIYSIIAVIFLLFLSTFALHGESLDIKVYNMISIFLIIAPLITFTILCVVNIKMEDCVVKKFINKFVWVSPIIYAMIIIIITSKTFEYASCFTLAKWRNKEIRYLMYDDMLSKYNLINMNNKEVHELIGHGEKCIPMELKKYISQLKQENQIIEIYNLGLITDTFIKTYRGYLLILFDSNRTVIHYELFETKIR